MTGVARRPLRPGSRAHDGVTPWQHCDTCGLRLGEGLTTPYDTAYYAGDPDTCPRCADGRMALPIERGPS